MSCVSFHALRLPLAPQGGWARSTFVDVGSLEEVHARTVALLADGATSQKLRLRLDAGLRKERLAQPEQPTAEPQAEQAQEQAQEQPTAGVEEHAAAQGPAAE